MRSRAVLALAVVVLAGVGLITACSEAAPLVTPHITLDLSVFQLRSDYAPRQAQIEIHNRSPHDITVTSARFSSTWFDGDASSASAPATVLAGATTDFPVVLGAPLCTAATAVPRVTVEYRTKNGARGEVTATPSIPFDSLGTVHASDCAKVAFETVATITPATALRYEEVDGRPIALLDLTFAPTGAAGSVILRSTEDTTLLAQREGQLRTVDLTFSAASAPTVLTLDYVPSRCEQHVVAEDKVGTQVPIRADAGSFSNALFTVAVSPAVKAEFYDWFARYCGWKN
ncbi:hypothetical protein [Lacisediminihabitans changchengi]|uniref:Uncharacterized protein n=1 Tax=Lacisediminihabitans changchengi TaxID=2787634 RepID=A0A934SIX6_9MICO|nr:hypothetical protein [Lacisediminihabitans changchengi]MBK4347527.1 hypothetical protein [Lacisediminihabitans changchengi]